MVMLGNRQSVATNVTKHLAHTGKSNNSWNPYYMILYKAYSIRLDLPQQPSIDQVLINDGFTAICLSLLNVDNNNLTW